MPPRRNRDRGGKNVKLSQEEKILRMEQKLLAEEEARRKKEEMMVQFLKDKLVREEKSTKFNMTKLQNQWRVIMRESKSSALKKDILILSQSFERIIDRKDDVIKSLEKDIDEAEEQHHTAFKNHVKNLKNFISFQSSQLSASDDDYNKELDCLEEEFESERKQILEKFQNDMNELTDIIHAMEQEFQEADAEARQEFHSTHEEIKNKNLEDMQVLRIQLESKVEEYWKQMQDALKSYNETSEEKKISFEYNKNKDENSVKEIEMQMRKIQRIQDKIAQLRSKLVSNSKEHDERNRVIKDEKGGVAAQFHNLKDEMNRFREQERARLTTMTLQSTAAMKELKRKNEKGERILKLSEMCRKYETEEEKVLPFYKSSLSPEEEEEVENILKEKANEPLAELFHDSSVLENFWKRYNKTLLDKFSLGKEHQTLVQENQQLRDLLKQYLDGISVSEEVLNQSNPLFIVNNKSNAVMNLSVPVIDHRVQNKERCTIIEASHVAKHVI